MLLAFALFYVVEVVVALPQRLSHLEFFLKSVVLVDVIKTGSFVKVFKFSLERLKFILFPFFNPVDGMLVVIDECLKASAIIDMDAGFHLH